MATRPHPRAALILQRVARITAVVVVAALFGLLVWKVAFANEDEVAGPLADGKTPPAPAFSLERLDGRGKVELASLRGKIVVLNWWASWCGPCREEMPLLQEASRRWADRDVVFVGIDVDDVRRDARAFLGRVGVTYANVYDGRGSTVGRYGVGGLPETYFVTSHGNVVYRIAGPVESDEEIDDAIRRAIRAS